jgi:hypothetical protein
MFNNYISALIKQNKAFRRSEAMKNVAWFNFFGGSRDILVSTPTNLLRSENEIWMETTHMKNVDQSLDHNSLLYNVNFLDALIPVIGQTMIAAKFGDTPEARINLGESMVNLNTVVK